jgi:purine nucleosidase
LIEERVKPVCNHFSQFVIEATGYDRTLDCFRTGKVFYLHDPLTVGVVINPDLVKKERLLIDVETQEGEYYGRISEFIGSPNIEACVKVNAVSFLDLFLSSLG